jgi:HlyD family secretion protein
LDKKIEKKPFYRQTRFWMYAAGSLFFLTLVGLILNDTGSKLNVEADKITISTVAEGDFQEFIPVTGTILPRTTFYLDAILGGTVENKFVEEGTMLKKGDKIIQLSNTNVQLSTLQQEQK